MCDEEVLENYLEGEPITDCKIRKLIQKRKIFPCYFGSALLFWLCLKTGRN